MPFVLTFLLFYGCATEEVSEKVEEPLPTEPQGAIEEGTAKPDEKIIEEEPEPVVEKKDKFHIFNPQLTYSEAYNGPLYGTSEQVGSASMDSYFENLDRNGINFFIGMFGISGEPTLDTLISDHGLGEVIDAAQKHPYRIIPFFNPGIGGDEVEQFLGEKLTGMYSKTLSASLNIVGNGFIRGFGEVETQEWDARHNDPRVIQLIDIAKNNDINFMFHPVASKIDDVEKIIEAYPDTIFLVHMFREDLAKSTDKLIKILKEHDNLYFSMDAAHIVHDNNMDHIYGFDSANEQSSIKKFVSYYDGKEKTFISSAIKAYKPLVDAVPNKVMWGTEIGPEYAFDPKVFDRAVKASRYVIAGFAPEHQEAVAYKNALRVFGEGVVADSSIKVINTRSWQDCSKTQMDACDDSCETPDSNSLTSEQEACFFNCLIEKQCKEVVEQDVG